MPPNSPIPAAPIVLELAPLPREQAGPFLILGVAKTATREQTEEEWARRLIWARKKHYKVSLEDINWAREVMNDGDKRLLADVETLNLDTPDGVLADLMTRRHVNDKQTACRPIDVEKSLADFTPPVEIPDMEEVRRSTHVPEVPREFPAVRQLLEQLAREPLDPWNVP
jgi:hypothetical protein